MMFFRLAPRELERLAESRPEHMALTMVTDLLGAYSPYYVFRG